MGVLQDYREQFPQYVEVDDETLATSLYESYYKDHYEPEAFRDLLGLPPLIEPEVEPTLEQQVDTKLDTIDEALDPSPFKTDMGMAENIGRLAGTRAARLGGQFVAGLDTLTGGKGGVIVEGVADLLKGVDLGGVHTAGPETISKAFEQGNLGQVGQEILTFGIETGGESIPDMIAVMTVMPAYVMARAEEMGQRRAENQGKDQAEAVDIFESLPFAMGSALLEKFGAKGILEPGKDMATEVGKSALKHALARAGKQAGRGLTREALQEFLQEGIVEYVGERWGTEAALEWREGLTRGAWASLAGGTFGGVAGGVVGGTQGAAEAYDAGQIPPEFDVEPSPEPVAPISGEPTPEPTPEPEAPVEPPTAPPTDAGPEPTPPPQIESGDDFDTKVKKLYDQQVYEIDQALREVRGFGPNVELGVSEEEMQQMVDIHNGERIPVKDIAAMYWRDELEVESAAEPEPEPFPEGAGEFVSERLKDADMRAELEYLASELVVGGGAMGALIRDKGGEVTGRVPSENPEWFQRQGREFGYTVKQVKNAIAKALAGEKLGPKQTGFIAQLIEGAELTEAEQEVDEKADDLERLGIDPESLMGEDIASTLTSFDEALETAYGESRDRTSEAQARLPAEEAEAQEEPAETELLDEVSNAEAGTSNVPHIGHTGAMSITPNREYWLSGANRTVRIPAKPMRREHIIKKMQRTFGLGIYQGNVKGATRLGFYRRGHGEIRIKSHNDIEVAAHEVGHWFDDRYPWIRQLYMKHKGEMKAVSYDVDKVFEGYAEFMRSFFTDEQAAIRTAPFFYDAFVAELKTKPYAQDLFEIQEMMHAWHLQGARARLASKMGAPPEPWSERFKAARSEIPDKILFETLDKLRPIGQAELAMAGELGDATVGPYKSARLAAGQRAVMEAVYRYGTIGWDENGDIVFTGEGLETIWKEIPKKLKKDYSDFTVAMHAKELAGLGKENLLRPDEIEVGIALGETNPVFHDIFERQQAWNSRMLDFAVQSGLLSEETKALWEEMYKSYVPFNRIIEAAGRIVSGDQGSIFKRLYGSTRNIRDPYESIITNTSRLVHMSLINVAKRNLYDMVDRVDNQTAALYATKRVTDVRQVAITADQVSNVVIEAFGLTHREFRMMEAMPGSEEEVRLIEMVKRIAEGMGDFITFYETGIAPRGTIDMLFREGKKEYYEVNDPLLLEAINQMGPRAHNLSLAILGGFAHLLRRGVTLTPTFQAKNLTRDSMNAFTLSKGQTIPIVGSVRELLKRLYTSDLYWEFMANGGGFSTTLEGHTADKVFSTGSSILSKFDRGMGAFEYATRIAEYRGLRKKGVSRREATFLGREISTDFAMRGASEAVQLLTVAKPFLNARMQGHYRIAREIGRLGPGGKPKFLRQQAFSYALRGMTAITIPSLALLAYNWNNPDYWDIPEHIRDLNWIIFFPGEGEGYWKIPKPFETGLLWGTLPERMVELWAKEDGEEFTDALLWMVLEAFNMNAIPQMVAPLYELQKNQKWTGAPIVPEYMKGIDSSEQYRHYTSDALVLLGRKLGISPLKAEHLVRGYLGTLGVWGLGVADQAVRSLYGDLSAGETATEPATDWTENWLMDPFVDKAPLRRTKSQDDFYEILKAARMMVDTVGHLQSADPRRLNAYLTESDKLAFMGVAGNLEKVAFEARQLNNQIDALYSAPMDPNEKRQLMDQLLEARNLLFRTTMQGVDRKKLRELSGQIKIAEQ